MAEEPQHPPAARGQDIAVKKLLLESRQGLREFFHEVQHRNLVSLVGCHKMPVYPFFSNNSVDHILFGGNYKEDDSN